MLCAVGDLIEDVVARVHDRIRRDTDTAATIWRRRGGSAANVAYFAAKLTGSARFVGCVGTDATGDALVARLTGDGVEVRGERRGRTGSIVVIASPDGERTMLTDRGSATELRRWDDSWLDDVDVLHLPLYSFSHEPLSDVARRAVSEAHRRGVHVSVDLSSVTLIEHLGPAAVRGLVRDVAPAVLFCTRGEADAADADDWRLLGGRLVVMKDGARPVRVAGVWTEETAFPVAAVDRVVDGTGAGDAFAAGFMVSLARGRPVPECVSVANEIAARVVGRAGATLEDE